MKIALISCTKLKKDYICTAEEMYSPSQLFSKALNYIKKQNYDEIFILSAKYGLISLNKEIEPYNKTLNDVGNVEKKVWSCMVATNLIAQKPKEVIFYAGHNYRKYLIPVLESLGVKCNTPLKGKGIGEQLKFYKNKL